MLVEVRRGHKLKDATYGTLWVEGDFLGYTVELPWDDNQKGSSCVPDGSYKLYPWNSKKHGNVLVMANPELKVWVNETDIPEGEVGRSTCLIHSANYAHELRGCIAPGIDQMTNSKGKIIGVSNSKMATRLLMSKLGDRKGHTLNIKWL